MFNCRIKFYRIAVYILKSEQSDSVYRAMVQLGTGHILFERSKVEGERF